MTRPSILKSAPLLDVNAIIADRKTRIIVCCGSGGVGKTTTSAALALRAAEAGRKVVVLTIDPARHVVMRGDVEISLTAKEFALLLYLARRGGEPASKPEILDNVWGADFEGNDNVVEVYVGYLRRKIDAPFGTSSLETVRGHGYRLVEAAE